MIQKTKPILFCDFDGVLCHDRFWSKLPVNYLEQVKNFLMIGEPSLIDEWMRGKYSAEEINVLVSKEIGMPYEELWGMFVQNCKTMCVSMPALELLNELRKDYLVILITGNMDSLARFTIPSLGLDKYFDHIVNSFYEGALKTDNGGETFTKYLLQLNAEVSESIVIDDSNRVCKVFRELGGTALRVTPEEDAVFHLKRLLGSR